MVGEFQNIKIQGMASAVPSIVEENMNYINILGERRTKKQIKLTGVSKRHISGRHQRTSDLCYAATIPLIEKLDWKKEDIKVLVFITQGPNYALPSTAFFLHNRLGLSKDCLAFDINLGCSSFDVGVQVVAALLQDCEKGDKGLLLIGDTASKVLGFDENINEDVIANRMLFGAAGAAIGMEKVENSNLKFMNKSDGNGFEAIIRHFNRGTVMDGTAVFEFAINNVSDDVKVFKKHFGLQENDIDYYIFHQAQKLILDNIAAICEFPEEKELRSLEEYGNTSGTSVPLTVCANRDKFADKDTVKLYLCGFGVGLSWGSILAEIPTENILPIIETDEHYDDDKKPAAGLQDKHILVIDSDLNMGENITRYLNDKSAVVVLAGREQSKLKEIQNDLFLQSYVVAYESLESDAVNSISKCCEVHSFKLDGIVFTDANMNQSLIEEVLLGLQMDDCLEDSVSIVIVSDIETLRTTKNQAAYLEEKSKLDTFVMNLQEKLAVNGIRVNGVLYDNSKMNLVQVTGNGQEWIERFLKEGCPENMKKSIYVGKAVKHLLSDDSIYTTGTLISVNL